MLIQECSSESKMSTNYFPPLKQTIARPMNIDTLTGIEQNNICCKTKACQLTISFMGPWDSVEFSFNNIFNLRQLFQSSI